MPEGKVYLVGAGPGSPDLITVRGLRLLRRADAVIFDALIHPELLCEIRPDAARIFAGKRGYCVGSTRQDAIHSLLAERAEKGELVVRLKGGDPCVFGRGGEEAEYLAERGIAFEIVPGVTTALAACASASIPLTHRDIGQAVAFVTGHHDPDSPERTLDWPALAAVGNLVIYMGLRHLDKIAGRLVAAGLSADTPAAVIASATLPAQHVVEGELCTLSALAAEAEVAAPAIAIVGEVVRFRSRLLALAESRATSSFQGALT